MILEFSDEAENDLERIVDYIAERNPQRALSFLQELRDKCEDLVDNPMASP
jgi:toxin ParE1/3/4